MTKSNDTIRILTSGTCQTLTGSSPLTYAISKEPEGGIHLRISNNSGGSFFSDEWVAFEDILQALKKRHEGKAITSVMVSPLFRRRSANTSGFLLAVLVRERVLRPIPGKLRRHEFVDTSAFMSKVEKLLTGGGEKGKTAQKPPGSTPKKKSAAPKKSKPVRGT